MSHRNRMTNQRFHTAQTFSKRKNPNSLYHRSRPVGVTNIKGDHTAKTGTLFFSKFMLGMGIGFEMPVVIRISEDLMQAWALYKPSKPPTEAEVRAALAAAEVTMGLDAQALARFKEAAEAKGGRQ